MTDNHSDQDLDNLMRSKLERKEFRFDESHWEAARKLIDNDRKQKRAGFFRPFLLLFALTGIAAGAFWMATTQPSQTEPQAASGPSSAPVVSIAPASNGRSANASASPPSEQKSQITQIAENERPEISAGDAKAPGVQPTGTGAKSAAGATRPVKATQTADEKPTRKQRAQKTASPASALLFARNAQHAPAGSTSAPRSTATPKQPGTPAPAPTASAPATSTTQSVTEKDAPDASASAQNTEQYPEELMAVKQGTRLNSIEIAPRMFAPSVRETGIPAGSLAQALPKSSGNGSVTRIEMRYKRFVSLEAGITAFNTTSSFNYAGGIRYYRFLSPQIVFSAGLFYAQLNQALGEAVYTRTQFGFGRKVDKTFVQTRELDYVQLPLHLGFELFRNHILSGGATFGYLINSRNTVVEEKAEGTRISRREDGHMYTASDIDLQAHIGYTILLPKHFLVSATFGYGLIDISSNQVFRSSEIDRNIGVNLLLGYQLFR